MESNKRNIDEFFQEELGKITEMPPASVWDTLEKRLDDQSSKRTPKIWWVYFLAGFMLMAGSIAAWYFLDNNQNISNADNKNNLKLNNDRIAENNNAITAIPITEIGKEIKKIEKSTTNANAKLNDEFSAFPANNSVATSTSGQLKTKRLTTSANNVDEVDKSISRNKNKEKIKKLKNNSEIKRKNTREEKAATNLENTNQNTGANKTNKRDNVFGKKDIKEQSNSAIAFSNKPSKTAISTPKKADKEATKEFKTEKAANNEETIVFKPKTTTSPKPIANNEYRGLSGVPEDMKAELDEDALKNKVEEEATIIPLARKKEIVKEKIAAQVKAIEQKRAQNPLSGTPLAANSIEEIPSSSDANGSEVEQASSGGGGAVAAQKDKIKKSLNMTIGVKAGFEKGFENYTSNKIVGNVFAEVKLGKKLSFIFQPGIKFANANSQFSKNAGYYIDAGLTNSTLYNTTTDTSGSPKSYDYAYSQSYDSIIATIVSQRQFLEVEVPFLLRYKLDKNLSLLAGLNFTFGKILGFTSELDRRAGLTIIDSIKNSLSASAPAPSARFSHSGTTAFKNYKEPATISPIRFGYTLGVSYTFLDRIMIDLQMQQNLSRDNGIGNEEIKKLYTQPYFRVSVGYNIFGSGKK